MHLVLRSPLHLPFPTRFLQGDEDEEVSVDLAQRLFALATGDDIQLRLLKGGDHRFSSPRALALTQEAITDVIGAIKA